MAHSLAVGRIADQASIFFTAGEIAKVTLLEVNLFCNARLCGVIAGETQSFFVNIRADDSHWQIRLR